MGVLFAFHFVLLFLWPLDTCFTVTSSPVKGDCPSTCGSVSIPYPFGIGKDCYGFGDKWFEIVCVNTIKPFLSTLKLEVLNITLPDPYYSSNYYGTILVKNPVYYSNCTGMRKGEVVNLTGSPFGFSQYSNSFTAVGCNIRSLMINDKPDVVSGCEKYCHGNISTGKTSCPGENCCQTTVPTHLKVFNTSFQTLGPGNSGDDCNYAFLVEDNWFGSNLGNPYAIKGMEYVPVMMEWELSNSSLEAQQLINGSWMESGYSSYHCTFLYAHGYTAGLRQCECNPGFEGNAYLENGCTDVNECDNPSLNECPVPAQCENTYGSYRCGKSPAKAVTIGLSTGFGTVVLLVCLWWLRKVIKRRKKIMRKQKFFKRNGGLLFQQQLSSSDGKLDTTKLFSSKELEIATDNFNANRVLGHGGQGTVYKGMLTDGKIVAVKKSKIVDEANLEQFINEVVILSHIDHRNVVKLLGCCLETEVPVLVYEFIPNGNLYEYLHDQDEEFQVSWQMRLQIATEVAAALSYLHSAASVPIYHRDIKSTNILLDEKYRAKVSDFGTSRSIAIEQTHLTTLVHGTFGYLDPEYFQSSQFTDKSDVYSFGVVLVELLTRQKAISCLRSEEGRSLATYFIISMEEHREFDILDPQVVSQAGKEEIMEVAKLAKRCLNLNGRNRPTMREVAMTLEGIKMSTTCSKNERKPEESEYGKSQESAPWDINVSTTMAYVSEGSIQSSPDVLPLLPYTC